MKININSLHSQFENKAAAYGKTDGEKFKNSSEQNTVNESRLQANLNTANPNPKEKQDTNSFDLSLIEGSAYEQIFKKEDLDFSNMSINDLHTLVKNVNDMEREYTQKYGSDEPMRTGKSGNPIISKKREDMLDLEATLKILSYGGGDVDPDKKIDTVEYFSNRSEQLDERAQESPERQTYNVAATYMKELMNTFDKFISDDTFDLYKEKAALLLTDEKKVDMTI
ncbi:hypothetical protein [Thalassomonas haliotis]|uniref:Uncharacterized protein n=1 Tax=Thalassomonas haliotis TaxID=485448 RepID=A0ABY7VAU0_9GAMM|nr:hypothetical protein [Thalassomonas haliotis]WDE10013.1 hypothetical protein H3N35_17105 [Thalassomonas haliotis]